MTEQGLKALKPEAEGSAGFSVEGQLGVFHRRLRSLEIKFLHQLLVSLRKGGVS